VLNPIHLRELVIIPALGKLPEDMRSAAAVNLLLGTALVESGLTYLKQGVDAPADMRGRALGLYQMEPATWEAINRYIQRSARIRPVWPHGIRPIEALMTDLEYATHMARVFYWRFREALPPTDDVWGLGSYWKRYWNTELGSGRPDVFVAMYRRYVLGQPHVSA
jgi:hypothetical protein